jgi:hypothetical protein
MTQKGHDTSAARRVRPRVATERLAPAERFHRADLSVSKRSVQAAFYSCRSQVRCVQKRAQSECKGAIAGASFML